MMPILKRLEQELLGVLLQRVLQIETGDVSDHPRTDKSFLSQLPLREWGFDHCPAIPYWADKYGDPDFKHILATLGKLSGRAQEAMPTAYQGLSTVYAIDNQTHAAYEFLYGEPYPGGDDKAPNVSPLPNELTLDDPDEFTLSWTTYKNVHSDSQDLVTPFVETLTDRDKATESFWPTIASFGLPYNLLVLAKVNTKRATELERDLGDVWSDEDMGALQKAGRLYEIDMRILGSLKPTKALDGSVRFTPGTVTVLKQDRESKALTPIAIAVSTEGHHTRVYAGGDKAWLWALQAAKTSITVWGIWLGHVYHWHIVTAAMQMAMYNHLPDGHRLYPLLQPQSQSLIDFDFVLLTHLWGQIAPPTPVAGYMPLLELLDRFAEDRTFFDDDPPAELRKRGLDVDDFTVVTPWDAYPVVGFLLDIWKITGEYVTAVVHDLYKRDDDVVQDDGLHKWIHASRDPHQGNVRGLPEKIKTRDELAKILTSILYRVTVHGAGSLNPAVNPVLSFVANFPPCLQSSEIPEPGHRVSDEHLLRLLPHTGTIGGMTTFYFTFVYSKPYERLIPRGSVESDPYFPSSQGACNAALFAYRAGISAFVDQYLVAWNAALGRIRGETESPPGYAEHQHGQWPRSVEI